MAPFEWYALMEEADAEPLVMLNFGSGTAAEAADYVTHLTSQDAADPLVAARAHWGRDQPYPVRVFEIGNETYGVWNTGYYARGEGYAGPEGDPEWLDRPSSDPEDYAARALAYADAVTAVYPEAVFWVPLSQASMDAWGGLEVALPALAPLLEDSRVTAVVVHHYHTDDTAAFGRVDKNDPLALMTLSERYAPLYLELRAALATIPREDPLEIAITEYHVAGAFARGQFRVGDAPILGLGIADMLISYAQLDIEHACQHMALNFADADDPGRDILLESWYVPFRVVEGVLRARASLEVTARFASVLLRNRVGMKTEAPTLDVGAYEAPALHGVAFRDEEQGRLIFLNRADAPIDVLVESAGWKVSAGTHFAPSDVLDAEAERAPFRGLRQFEGTDLLITAPPHSVTTLDFEPLAER